MAFPSSLRSVKHPRTIAEQVDGTVSTQVQAENSSQTFEELPRITVATGFGSKEYVNADLCDGRGTWTGQEQFEVGERARFVDINILIVINYLNSINSI